DRTWIGAQPGYALLDDLVRLAHLLHANQIAVVAVAGGSQGNVELHPVVDRVRLLLAQVPPHARAAQHRPGEPERHRALRCDHADADSALLTDAVAGQQRLVLIDVSGKAAGEILDAIELAASAARLHSRPRLA